MENNLKGASKNMRQFNGRVLELLAPVKTFEDFLKTIHSKADAVYFGGKKFNMRVHNKDYNLTNEEIKKAVEIAHSLGKKVYVTFNNMMSDSELEDAVEYLNFLEIVGPDAIIVQDFGALHLIRTLGLKIECHLSVMANVHNEQMVEEALTLGVTRVVLSREIQLHEVARLVDKYPEMEYEYFVHGDMCTVHGAQCYMSASVFAGSSNRGKCMKPCRWKFENECGDLNHPLAAKDLSLYRHLPQLINSGVNSFKIEGRMRDVNYMIEVINIYAEAIDRYLSEPTSYITNTEAVHFLQDNRIRNISTAYAFKIPGAVNIDSGGREPRVFSKPTAQREITQNLIEKVRSKLRDFDLTQIRESKNTSPEIAVTVNDIESFYASVDAGANIVYLPLEVFRPSIPFTISEIIDACEHGYKKGVSVYLALPRMLNNRQFLEIDQLVEKLKDSYLKGLLVSNLGQVRKYRNSGLELIGDFGMNVFNQLANTFYQERGVMRTTVSIESNAEVLQNFLVGNRNKTEVIIQGSPVLMYMEHCLKAAQNGITRDDWCLEPCMNENFDIKDVAGNIHRVRADQYCKNHILPLADVCFAPILKEIIGFGVDVIRIEAKDYTPDQIFALVTLYKSLLENDIVMNEDLIFQIEKIANLKQSFHALIY